jgi:hypothetical protein
MEVGCIEPYVAVDRPILERAVRGRSYKGAANIIIEGYKHHEIGMPLIKPPLIVLPGHFNTT